MILRFDSGTVTLRSRSVVSNWRSSSSRSSCSRARFRVDHADLLAFLQEDAVACRTSDLMLTASKSTRIAFADGPLVFVAVDHVVEIGFGVGGRRGGQADLDGVEMVEGVAPDRQLGGRVAAMAFVGDDDVEGVDRDVELVGVVVGFVVALLEDRLAAEKVDGHALDGADVDEDVAGLRIAAGTRPA